MQIILIVATDLHGVIGRQGQTPWSNKTDLQFFKQATMGHSVIMGRKTYESLPVGKLPGRDLFVLSRSAPSSICYTAGSPVSLSPLHGICSSLETILRHCRDKGDQAVFIAGGAEIYKEAEPYASLLIHTMILTDCGGGDAHFKRSDDWELLDEDHDRDPSIVINTYNRPGRPFN